MHKRLNKSLRTRRALQAGAVVSVTAWALLGCGGGGSEEAPPATFALQSAYANWAKNGSSAQYTVGGDCRGQVTLTRAASTPAVFEGVTGFMVLGSASIQFSSCSNAAFNGTFTSSGSDFYDPSYAFIGSTSTDEFTTFTAVRPTALPPSVAVGSQGALGTLTVYSDNTKSTLTGTSVQSYAIETDVPAGTNSVILNLISKDYDTANRLTLTAQFRHRVTSAGVLTEVSADFASESGRITYTRN